MDTMFSNILLVTAVVFVLWLVAMGYYLYASREQESLEDQIEAVQNLLDKNDGA
jgi:RsiW-degrading membrane proteinase PrsW (M82 family)